MSEEKKSGVQNTVELLNKLHLARVEGLTHIQRLIPYLQYRKEAAKKYFHPDGDETTRANYADIVLEYNKEIIAILGL